MCNLAFMELLFIIRCIDPGKCCIHFSKLINLNIDTEHKKVLKHILPQDFYSTLLFYSQKNNCDKAFAVVACAGFKFKNLVYCSAVNAVLSFDFNAPVNPLSFEA